MILPQWDSDMKFELLRLKSELRAENFRALHHPIGLGHPTASRQESQGTSLSPLSGPSARSTVGPAPVAPRLGAAPPLPLPSLPMNSASPMPRSLTKIFFIHFLDIVFVLITLGLGLLFACWLIDPGHVPWSPEQLKQASPLRFLREVHVVGLMLALYSFFSLYWLFFKLVSGSTLGESFLDNFWTLQKPRTAASIKDSGDS